MTWRASYREARTKIDTELGADMRKKGYRVEFGGQYENLVRASQDVLVRSPAGPDPDPAPSTRPTVHSWDSLRVFTGVPFALVGGVIALDLRGMPFSISAAWARSPWPEFPVLVVHGDGLHDCQSTMCACLAESGQQW